MRLTEAIPSLPRASTIRCAIQHLVAAISPDVREAHRMARLLEIFIVNAPLFPNGSRIRCATF